MLDNFPQMTWFMNKTDNKNRKPRKIRKDPLLGSSVNDYAEDRHAEQKAADYFDSE